MILKNIEVNYDLKMNPVTIYQSTVNNQIYTLVKPCNLLRYFPPTDTWVEVSVNEIFKALTNYQYVEYHPNKSDDYIECTFEEAYLVTDSGIGYAYVKLLDQYISLSKLKASVDLKEFVEYIASSTNLKFYKDKFARPYCHMNTLEEENLVIPLNDPYDDIYY